MTKQELRTHFSHRRKEFSPDSLQRISEQICELFFKHIPVENKCISLFLPIERQQEINTYVIWEKALGFDAKVAVPKANFETNELKHILFETEEQLELSAWGIPEPKRGKVIAADRFDYVLVPLLAIDKKGNRVGYGKGFYDRFLKKCSPGCKFIGLSHFDAIDRIDDTGATDVKLHAYISPTSFHWFD